MLTAKNAECIYYLEPLEDKPANIDESIYTTYLFGRSDCPIYTKIIKGPCILVEDDKTKYTFVFPKEKLLPEIDRLHKHADELIDTIGTEYEEYYFNIKPDKIHAKIDEIKTLIESIDENKAVEIVNCLPRNKNGSFRKKTIPVYISDITYRDDNPDAQRKNASIKLSLKYNNNNQFELVWSWDRNTRKKVNAIIDSNGNCRSITKK